MSLNAKVLPFPAQRDSARLSPVEADLAACEFLAIPVDRRSDADREEYLGSPDVLLALCSRLRGQRDLAPAVVETEAIDAYRWISRPECELGLFDERDYFLGELSLLAAAGSRQLGKREEAFRWLDRAYEERSTTLTMLKVEAKFDPLRSDKRFGALLQRMKLA